MIPPLEVLRTYRDHDYTLADAFRSRRERDPDRPFLWFDGATTSWEAFAREVSQAVRALLALGVGKGDRVAVKAANTPEHVLLLFALARLGAIMAPINPDFGAQETAYLLAKADVSGVLVEAAGLDLVRQASGGLSSAPWLATIDAPAVGVPRFRDLMTDREELREPDERLIESGGPDDPCIIIFTSGTTGFPKAVLHSQRSFVTAGEAFVARVHLQSDDRAMIVLPLYHMNAEFYSVGGTLAAGASMAIFPRFSASRFWSGAVESGATEVNIIEAAGNILVARPRSEFRPEHRLRAVYGVRESFRQAFRDEFGIRDMVSGYGMSEIPGVTSTQLAGPHKPGSMGRIGMHPDPSRAWAACRIVDEAGADVGADTAGELLVKTPIVMKGYFRDPELTEAAFVDGWFRTGDLVRRDEDGFYFFVGRKSDIIRRRGENIAGAEIDRVITSHPAVFEAAVIAVPSDLGEDEILAVIAPEPGRTPTAQEIADWCAERLAPMKVPRYVAFVDELPHTPTLKIAKAALRQDAALLPSAVDLGPRAGVARARNA